MVDAGDPTPIPHALFRTAFLGREIDGRLLARLPALADPGRPIPASTGAGADRAGGYLVVLVDGGGFSACGAFGAAGVY